MSTPANTTPAAIQAVFRAAYWASLPTPVRALNNQSLTQNQRVALVQSLISQGYAAYLINAVDDYDWDVFTTFASLAADGLTWIPNILQISLNEPGQYALPGMPALPGSLGPYPATPPDGSILIPPVGALNSAAPNEAAALIAQWFPPFTPPAPAPAAPTDPVGAQAVGTMYLNAAGVSEANWPNGAEFTDSRGTFTHIVTATPFGAESYWLLNT